MTFFVPDHLRAVVNGRWLARGTMPRRVEGVGTDSRVDLSERVFIALRGATHDAHDHLGAAAAAGASLLIVERESIPLPPDIDVLLVPSTLEALGRLAAAYRRTLASTRVIAITGSSGKTTTKRLVHAVLGRTMRGSSSPKSYNNAIGVPLTLLAASPNDQYVVVEAGTSSPGEIGVIGHMAAPDIAVITNIGHAHLGGFGTREAIAAEKASLLRHVDADGIAVLDADAPHLREFQRLVATTVLYGESADADLRLTGHGRTPDDEWWMEINGRVRFTLALPGRHNALNALAAVAVARRLGLRDETIASGLASVRPEAMRLETTIVGGVRYVNDAYNANPESMLAAVETFPEVAADAERRIVIIGEMLELGAMAADLHDTVADALRPAMANGSIDLCIFLGPHAASMARRAGADATRVRAVPRLDDASIRDLVGELRPGDAVLLKASRGVGLERLVRHAEVAAALPHPS